MSNTSRIPKELVTHLGFHAIWAVLALLAGAGALLFIPFIAIYETFVLGIVFHVLPDAPALAYAAGGVLFLLTALGSIGMRRILRKGTSWTSGFLSLALTVAALVAASFFVLSSTLDRQAAIAEIQPASILSDAGEFDRLGYWIKAAYYLPKHPPFLTNSPSVVRLETLLPKSKGATSVPAPEVSGWYLNLDPDCWAQVRSRESGFTLVAWSDVDNGRYAIVQLNLSTSVVIAKSVESAELQRLYSAQRSFIMENCPSAQLPESPPEH